MNPEALKARLIADYRFIPKSCFNFMKVLNGKIRQFKISELLTGFYNISTVDGCKITIPEPIKIYSYI